MPLILAKSKSAGNGEGSRSNESPDRMRIRPAAISCASSRRFVVISEAYLFPRTLGRGEMAVASDAGKIGRQGISLASWPQR